MIDREDHERLASARQAAEALFPPKSTAIGQLASDPAQPVTKRKPRVLPVLPPAAIRPEAVGVLPTSKSPATLEIPRAKFGRIRTLVKYGMTAGQVAELYGVPVETVERLLRKS